MVIIRLSAGRPLSRPLICFNMTADPCNQRCCRVSHQTRDRPLSFRIRKLDLPLQCHPISVILSYHCIDSSSILMVWDFMLWVCYVGYKAMQSVPTAFIEQLKSLFICCSFNIMLFKNTPSMSE